MKCKCGDTIRITANGVSSCWKCYGESRVQHDVFTATNIAETYKRYFGAIGKLKGI